MYRVEMIPKQSTINECLEFWKASGREDETGNGQFVFEDVEAVPVDSGTLEIHKGGQIYLYNLADFYRIKIIPITE